MTKPNQKVKEWTKIIARMVYGIQGSDKNQPKMVRLNEATSTFSEIIDSALTKQKQEIKEVVEGMKKDTSRNMGAIIAVPIEGYNQALKDVLEKL